MSTSVAILSSIREKEKRIKDLKDSSTFGQVNEILASLRKDFRSLLVDFPFDKCHSNDIIGRFWKVCFYKQIEEFRKAIKSCKVNSSLQRTGTQDELVSLTSEFSSFLADSIRYFNKLMNDLEKKVSELLPSNLEERKQMIHFIYRCLLYLGDIARYRELYSDKNQKEFSDCVRYYERAAFLVPSSGNPHNQLAMLATYNEAESTALYHYCRSIMCKVPFSGGVENLVRLFSCNKVIYEQMRKQFIHESLKSAKADSSLKFRFFLTTFVRFHGILFALSVKMHLDYTELIASTNQNCLLSKLNSQLSTIVQTNEEDPFKYAEKLLASLFEDFDEIVQTVKMSDLHLLRLVAVGFFSVHFSEPNFDNVLVEDNLRRNLIGPDYSIGSGLNYFRSKSQSLALMCLFGTVSRSCNKLLKSLPNEKLAKGYDKIFPMLSIFCAWVEEHEKYLNICEPLNNPSDEVAKPSVFTQGFDDSKWKRMYCADKEMIRQEIRSRSNVKSALSLLCETIQPVQPVSNDKSLRNSAVLREFAEMRGYLPLGDRFEQYFCDFDPLRKQSNWLSDLSAKQTRQRIVCEFSKKVSSRSQIKGDNSDSFTSLAIEPKQYTLEEDNLLFPKNAFLFPSNEVVNELGTSENMLGHNLIDDTGGDDDDLDDDLIVFQPAFTSHAGQSSLNLPNAVVDSPEHDSFNITTDILASLGIVSNKAALNSVEFSDLWLGEDVSPSIFEVSPAINNHYLQNTNYSVDKEDFQPLGAICHLKGTASFGVDERLGYVAPPPGFSLRKF